MSHQPIAYFPVFCRSPKSTTKEETSPPLDNKQRKYERGTIAKRVKEAATLRDEGKKHLETPCFQFLIVFDLKPAAAAININIITSSTGRPVCSSRPQHNTKKSSLVTYLRRQLFCILKYLLLAGSGILRWLKLVPPHGQHTFRFFFILFGERDSQLTLVLSYLMVINSAPSRPR